MVLRLSKKGIQVNVLSNPESDYTEIFKDNGIHVHPYKPQKKFSRREIRYIRDIISNGKYNIVHVFNNKAVTNVVLASLGLPVKVITYRGYTGHLLWYKPTSWLSHLHPKVSKITCVSEGLRKQVKRQLLFNKNKAVTVYKGHDPAWYENVRPYSRQELNVPENAFLVGCVANARPMKGIPYLIRASYNLGEHPDIHFLFIGKNMNSEKHLKLIRKSPINNNFHLPGFKNDVLNHLSACDVLVLPSIKGEGLSKVTIEAMTQSLPVVATDVGGNAELVLNEETGLLVQPKSPGEIANALIHMKNNPQKRGKMGEKARMHILKNFHIDQTVEQMEKLYRNLANESKKPSIETGKSE
jgi:glycosyltransferase involved in cell wall biosynthesis